MQNDSDTGLNTTPDDIRFFVEDKNLKLPENVTNDSVCKFIMQEMDRTEEIRVEHKRKTAENRKTPMHKPVQRIAHGRGSVGDGRSAPGSAPAVPPPRAPRAPSAPIVQPKAALAPVQAAPQPTLATVTSAPAAFSNTLRLVHRSGTTKVASFNEADTLETLMLYITREFSELQGSHGFLLVDSATRKKYDPSDADQCQKTLKELGLVQSKLVIEPNSANGAVGVIEGRLDTKGGVQPIAHADALLHDPAVAPSKRTRLEAEAPLDILSIRDCTHIIGTLLKLHYRSFDDLREGQSAYRVLNIYATSCLGVQLVEQKLPHDTTLSLMVDRKQTRFRYDRHHDRFFDLATPQGFQLSGGRCVGSAQGQASVIDQLPDEAFQAIYDELGRMQRTGSADSQRSVSDDDKQEVCKYSTACRCTQAT